MEVREGDLILVGSEWRLVRVSTVEPTGSFVTEDGDSFNPRGYCEKRRKWARLPTYQDLRRVEAEAKGVF
jgi:hypothetical protein